ncbi:hypothetical protein N431DRAFT_456689 [Stipitochalara longipes BDJ]|nr:hypothetical protein N431DRAFT_456689 [Stipitochalara longipes BDJ]
MSSLILRIFLGFNFDLPTQANLSEEELLEDDWNPLVLEMKLARMVDILAGSGIPAVKRREEDECFTDSFVKNQDKSWHVFSAWNGSMSTEIGVASPPLIMDASSFKTIRHVCEVLKANIESKFRDDFIFRVHISNNSKLFDDQLVKCLRAFIWNIETVLDKFHPPRLSLPDNELNYERQTLRENNNL